MDIPNTTGDAHQRENLGGKEERLKTRQADQENRGQKGDSDSRRRAWVNLYVCMSILVNDEIIAMKTKQNQPSLQDIRT